MNRYRVTFDRIGRNHDVAPLDVVGENDSEVAFHVHQYARPRLTSNDVTVNVDLDAMRAKFSLVSVWPVRSPCRLPTDARSRRQTLKSTFSGQVM